MSNTKKLIQAAAGAAGGEAPTELTLYQWGENSYGQVGNGDSRYDANLQRYTTSNDFPNDSRGRTYSARNGSYIAIKSDGTCWVWGNNNNGQLGLGDTTNRSSPVQLGTETDFTAVDTSGYHTLFIRGGDLYGMGGNAFGNLGTSDTTSRSSPVQIPFSNTPQRIAAGTYYSSFVIDTSQQLWSAGYNFHGQLGQGDTTDRSSFTQVGGRTFWSEVAASNCIIAATTTQELYTWGNNQYGALGDQTSGYGNDKCSPVQIGSDKSWDTIIATTSYGPQFACDNSGNLWAIGGVNAYGQLGIGDTTARSSPVQVTTQVKGIAIGGGSGFAAAPMLLKTNDTIWTWGVGASGFLADGTSIDRSSPVQVGSLSTWGYPDRGMIVSTATGSDDFYIFGDVGYALGSNFNYSSPVQIGAANEWKTSSNGGYHTLAIKTNGTLWAWGQNVYGQLGKGDFTQRNSPVQVGNDSDWSQVAAGEYHSAAIKEDGTLYMWGRNATGQLGNGTTTNVNTATQLGTETYLDVSCGEDHTASIRSNGEVWVWGSNFLSKLGNTGSDRSSPIQTAFGVSDAVQICAGSNHTVFRRDGQAGLEFAGNSQQYQAGAYYACLSSFTTIQAGYTFDDVSSGNNHIAGLVGSSLYTWGNNASGQLGQGNTSSGQGISQIAGAWRAVYAGRDLTFAVKTDNTIFATGTGSSGKLGLGDTNNRSNFTQIGANSVWWEVAQGSMNNVSGAFTE